jgi:hypothetical protein
MPRVQNLGATILNNLLTKRQMRAFTAHLASGDATG